MSQNAIASAAITLLAFPRLDPLSLALPKALVVYLSVFIDRQQYKTSTGWFDLRCFFWVADLGADVSGEFNGWEAGSIWVREHDVLSKRMYSWPAGCGNPHG